MVNAETDSGPHETSSYGSFWQKKNNGFDLLNTFAKISSPGVWQNPKFLWERFNDIIQYTNSSLTKIHNSGWLKTC